MRPTTKATTPERTPTAKSGTSARSIALASGPSETARTKIARVAVINSAIGK
jgi:hypothetical protein